MGKQPYIPIYIGDWEQDTNCISLETEGALLKLIFKLWKADNKGRLLISFNQLSILLKNTPEKCRKIVSELAENGILNVEFRGENDVFFESRRMIRDMAKSLIYSENGAKGGRPLKANKKQTKSKSKAKTKPFTEYDSDNEYDNESDIKNEKKAAPIKFNPTDHIPDNWNTDLFLAEWDDYMISRKKKKWSCADKVLAIRINQLRTLSGDDWGKALAMLQKSTERGYAEFFAPETGNTPKNAKQAHREKQESDYKKPFGQL